jgi:hypothetical protein
LTTGPLCAYGRPLRPPPRHLLMSPAAVVYFPQLCCTAPEAHAHRLPAIFSAPAAHC